MIMIVINNDHDGNDQYVYVDDGDTFLGNLSSDVSLPHHVSVSLL